MTEDGASAGAAWPTGPAVAGTALRGGSRLLKLGCLAAAIVLIAVGTVLISQTGSGHGAPAPPRLARTFSLAKLGHPDARVSLASYAGKPLIVNFFASWCTPCRHETPLLARFYASEHGQVTVVGIDSNDQTAAALRFARNTGIGYPVGVDPYPSTTTTSYGVLALPQTFFLNAQHRIVSHVIGPLTLKDLTTGVALMDKERG